MNVDSCGYIKQSVQRIKKKYVLNPLHHQMPVDINVLLS